MFKGVGKVKAPIVEHLKGASLGMALSFRSNIRLGWKSWTGTNSLAYNNVYITVVKSFIIVFPGVCVLKSKTL